LPNRPGDEAKDLGIEFVHFDQDDKPESQHIIPLGNFISDQPLTSEEYLITRSLVAAQGQQIIKAIPHLGISRFPACDPYHM
jgi:hypothetical protein